MFIRLSLPFSPESSQPPQIAPFFVLEFGTPRKRGFPTVNYRKPTWRPFGWKHPFQYHLHGTSWNGWAFCTGLIRTVEMLRAYILLPSFCPSKLHLNCINVLNKCYDNQVENFTFHFVDLACWRPQVQCESGYAHLIHDQVRAFTIARCTLALVEKTGSRRWTIHAVLIKQTHPFIIIYRACRGMSVNIYHGWTCLATGFGDLGWVASSQKFIDSCLPMMSRPWAFCEPVESILYYNLYGAIFSWKFGESLIKALAKDVPSLECWVVCKLWTCFQVS